MLKVLCFCSWSRKGNLLGRTTIATQQGKAATLGVYKRWNCIFSTLLQFNKHLEGTASHVGLLLYNNNKKFLFFSQIYGKELTNCYMLNRALRLLINSTIKGVDLSYMVW